MNEWCTVYDRIYLCKRMEYHEFVSETSKQLNREEFFCRRLFVYTLRVHDVMRRHVCAWYVIHFFHSLLGWYVQSFQIKLDRRATGTKKNFVHSTRCSRYIRVINIIPFLRKIYLFIYCTTTHYRTYYYYTSHEYWYIYCGTVCVYTFTCILYCDVQVSVRHRWHNGNRT